MSLRGVTKIMNELNAGLRIYKNYGGLKPNCAAAILDVSVTKDTSLLSQQLSALSLHKSQTEKFCCTFPIVDVGIKKNIIDIIEPNKAKLDLELPIRKSNNTALELPVHTEKEIAEPGKVIIKRAAHMITIRKRKMRKHKRKKFVRKHKIEIAKRKLWKAMEKEDNFQNSLKLILNKKDSFSAENYVSETLEKAHWERPVTKVRGQLAPKWVIREYLKAEEEQRILKERIEECTK